MQISIWEYNGGLYLVLGEIPWEFQIGTSYEKWRDLFDLSLVLGF
jgi:predicted transcriptional regulator